VLGGGAAYGWLIIVAMMAYFFLFVRDNSLDLSRVSDISEKLRTRTPKMDPNQLLTYIHRELDRQINKVRGVLTFNAILVVAARVDAAEYGLYGKCLLQAALVYVSLSIVVCLYTFLVRWGDLREYDSFDQEFKFKLRHVGERTLTINYALALSMVSAIAIAAVFVPAKFL
jgi:hypothetical protein